MSSPNLIPATACNMVARFDNCGRGRRVTCTARTPRNTHTGRLAVTSRAARVRPARVCSGAARRTWRAACGVSTMQTAGFASLYAPSRASQSRMCGDDDGSCAPGATASGPVSDSARRRSVALLHTYS
jgi:hypothetical protein